MMLPKLETWGRGRGGKSPPCPPLPMPMSSQEKATVQGPNGREQPNLSKLTDSEDIEVFLKTFEQVMEAYQVDQSLYGLFN